MKTIIIGGVAGGASCAARLRRLNEETEIIMLERGDYISYANCGLPYRVGDVIGSKDALLLQTPEVMKSRFNVDVRVRNEAVAIHKEQKTLDIKNLETGEIYTEEYDNLVLATGSSPLRPKIPGIDSPRIQTVWTVNDTEQILSMLEQHHAKSAAVIGGGFIGVEMAENLHHRGLKVSLVEAADQVLTPMDFEMAQLLHENMVLNGVDLRLGDGVSSFQEHSDGVDIQLNSGETLSVDYIILSIGIRPNSELAKDAGLDLNGRGGIIVDSTMKTSDEFIYAVGDATETREIIFGEPSMVALASIANKQGRMVANSISGVYEKAEEYQGSQGTSVIKVFDLSAAFTGKNEATLKQRGLQKGIDYESVIITQNSHAGYYPGATPLTLKLLFSMDGNKIFGAQIVGVDGVDKRIDTIATTLRLGGGIRDLKNLELAYAPPFSSAKDPVNMAGFTASNVLEGTVAFSSWNLSEDHPDALLLDVREEAELMAYSIPGAVHIPLGQLREHLDELNRDCEIITFCAIGVRSYNAARILMHHGFQNVKVYPGGTKFLQSMQYEDNMVPLTEAPVPGNGVAPNETAQTNAGHEASTDSHPTAVNRISLNCVGMQCPGPIVKVYDNMKDMKDGDILEVAASDPGFVRDIDAWCRRTGNQLLETRNEQGQYVAVMQKNPSIETTGKTRDIVVEDTPEGKTIIVFSGDLDKVLASFIIANGAAAMGRPVTMFFTFWGLTVLRKEQKVPVQKSFMEKMFGFMLPRGSKKLKLSKMNMGGMGTAMMKKIMNDKNVDSLEDLIAQAMKNGVKIVACTMSMDVMGIKEEELMEGVELAGVGSYLGDAEEANVNLFI